MFDYGPRDYLLKFYLIVIIMSSKNKCKAQQVEYKDPELKENGGQYTVKITIGQVQPIVDVCASAYPKSRRVLARSFN